MASLYLDNDVSLDLVPLLFDDGHAAVSTRQVQLTDNHDVAQLLAATNRAAVLITHNREDFILVHRAWVAFSGRWQVTEEHYGILILPHGPEPALRRYLRAILETALPLRNRCYRYRPASNGWEVCT